MSEEDKQALLHVLRNPYNWSQDTVRDVRNQAADELQRLWNLESEVARRAKALVVMFNTK